MNNHKHSGQHQRDHIKDTASRRQTLKGFALVSGALFSQLPANWRRPVIDSVLMPAHAQTSFSVITPDPPPAVANAIFTVARIGTVFRIPSGEVVPVLAFSRIRLSGCGLLSGDVVAVRCFAMLRLGAEIECINTSATATSRGILTVNEDIAATILLPAAEIDQLRFELSWSTGSESYTATTAELDAAIASAVPPAVCS